MIPYVDGKFLNVNSWGYSNWKIFTLWETLTENILFLWDSIWLNFPYQCKAINKIFDFFLYIGIGGNTPHIVQKAQIFISFRSKKVEILLKYLHTINWLQIKSLMKEQRSKIYRHCPLNVNHMHTVLHKDCYILLHTANDTAFSVR